MLHENGDSDLESALTALRIEHTDILIRISDVRAEAKEIDKSLSNGESWISKSFEFRIHITEARVFLEKHADQETSLFEKLRNRFSAI